MGKENNPVAVPFTREERWRQAEISEMEDALGRCQEYVQPVQTKKQEKNGFVIHWTRDNQFGVQ